MSKHNAIDKELMKQAETGCGFDPDMFAALIRADEREACAKVCDAGRVKDTGLPSCYAHNHALENSAKAIRARGNT